MEFIKGFFSDQLIALKTPAIYNDLLQIGISIILAVILYYIIKIFVLKYVAKVVIKTKTNIDDVLLEQGVLKNILYFVPIFVIFIHVKDLEIFGSVVYKFFYIFLIIQSLRVFNRIIESLEIIFSSNDKSRFKNLKILLQTFQMFITIVSVLLIVTVILDSSILKILSGIGAMTAVLMLIFKDTILSFSASFHISMNKLIEMGDWIQMPAFSADGDIIDISLNNVKVQNFDKTVVSIPKYKFLDTSFINWKGMQQSGGRRIKRDINIDQTTIEFCTSEMLKKFQKIDILADFIKHKLSEIEGYNSQIPNDELINNRALTNIGVFRHYIEYYLKNHSDIKNDGFTLMVRQLQSTDRGLPIQVYCFTNTTDWGIYESIQADIFDHILSVVGYFNLKLYQLPSGSDFNHQGL